MRNINKTIIFTIIVSSLSSIMAFLVQINGQNNVNKGCSYLDPIIIDILAFLAALFLVIEGIFRIIEHKEDSLKKQLTRTARVAIGFSILTLHTLQFIHK